ncbi:hypothetical protein CAPTEDRAFT_113004 [Capitella teleta]|uniref:G-protein coupled receptors family 1 profile domain-containing protein n=1 Tax=Capitella teleta TaxID=283909 RepID=R7TRJ4_CAPTE|nr:hypothetical protein CAPTEDRAFT_113004 [Capitella teleta]|eukprot:ELT93650.1 hypothetical protein CAPTEDRAFT_113004 [Capitella teleta]
MAVERTTEFPLNTTEGINHSQEDEGGVFGFAMYSVTVPLLFGIITLIGVIGNSLVIYVILSRKRMHSVTNILLLNLAVADLSFVMVIPPFTAYQFAKSQWPFGDAVCKLMHYLVNVTAYVTVYTLVLISAIRYMTIVHHTATAQLRTKRKVILMIIGIWSLMLLLNSPVMVVYSSQSVSATVSDCNHNSLSAARYLFTTFFTFAYLIPLLIIGVLSVCILYYIQSQKVSLVDKNRRTKSFKKKRRASRLIILVVVIFAILWLPIHIHLLLAFYGHLPSSKFYHAVSVLFNCAAYANSCVNPFIYNHASREFRQAFREVICCIPGGRLQGPRLSLSTGTTKLTLSPLDAANKSPESEPLQNVKNADEDKSL